MRRFKGMNSVVRLPVQARRPVAAMQGRVHQYEGYSAEEVAFPIRMLAGLGVRAVVLSFRF